MSIIHLAHGTSSSRFENILANGFGNYKDTVWNCSDPELTYFYQLDKFMEYECEDDEELALSSMISRANESAQITQALEKHPGDKTYVFEIIIDTDKVDASVIKDDVSCEYMNTASTVPDEVLNKWIQERKVSVRIHEFTFYSKLALLYLANIADFDYLQESIEKLSEAERFILKELKRSSVYIEELFYAEEENVYDRIIVD